MGTLPWESEAGVGYSPAREGAGMRTRVARPLTILTVLALSLVSVGCGAIQTKAHEPVGVGALKPTQEDHHAGLVGIAHGFDLKVYRIIAVDRISVSAPEVKDDEDKKLAAQMSSFFQAELVGRLRASGLFERVVNLSETAFEPGVEKALKLDGTITHLSGGSRALRFWISLGAGRSKAQAEIRFVDVQSGQPVMVTADRRVGAISEAASIDYGGDSEDLLKQSFDNMARDQVKFLERLARGEAPKP